MKAFATVVALVLLTVFLGSFGYAQSANPLTTAGGREWQVWAGGGHGTNGRFQDTSVANVGLRYGWVLTNPHLPGFLRGSFEYAVDAVPVFILHQPTPASSILHGADGGTGTAFGAGVNPVNLKWNFVTHGSWTPFVELGGGTLFTTDNAPPGTSKINFTSGGAIGFTHRGNSALSLDLRYMHISNAGLTVPNPGINTIQLRFGWGRIH